MTKNHYQTIIVGGGIAGLTATAYLAKEGQKVALFEKQDKLGGLIQTFHRNQVYFDGGLRSLENSGTVIPMLRQLGLTMDWERSHTSIGIGDKVMVIKDHNSIKEYENFLIDAFPDSRDDIIKIIKEVRKIMDYMDVLYGIDNPTFMDLKNNLKYVFKEMLPWIFKFLRVIRKIDRLNEPIEKYLTRFTGNQALNDVIAQHFFQQTPASFALSYFSLYLDYHYPKGGGGTATLPLKLAGFIRAQGGEIFIKRAVARHNPEQKTITDEKGETYSYDQMIWAGDLNQLYQRIPQEEIKNKKLVNKINKKINYFKDLRGGDSVFSVYLTVELKPAYFIEKCTGHFFYTPSKKGLSMADKSISEAFIALENVDTNDTALKEKIKAYLIDFCHYNTIEIAMPVLRDPLMAPKGKTGLEASLLFDYRLAKKIDEAGWTAEIKELLEVQLIKVLDESIFPGLAKHVSHRFSSSPLTIEKRTGSFEGGITGWAFTNPYIPVVNKMLQVNKSVKTIFPDIYQAGQWTFSPSGMPTGILTGKLAADKVMKRSK